MLSIKGVRIWSDLELTLFKMLFAGRGELGSDELEAALLEASDDLADETTVNTIRLENNPLSSMDDKPEAMNGYLDHDVGALTDVWGHV
jgi:hypothetical protein